MQYSENKIENIVFQALAHPVRRTILKIVASSVKGISYTELITELGLSTGKLNYHLEQLQGLTEKNNERLYVLTPLIKEEMTPDDEKYIRIAESAQKSSLQPTVKSFLLVGIAFSSMILIVWIYVAYTAITEGAPIIVYVLLPILIAIGLGLIGSLILAFKRTPGWIRRFERRFSNTP